VHSAAAKSGWPWLGGLLGDEMGPFLAEERVNINPKLVGDQQRHGVDINLNVYTQMSLANRLEAVEIPCARPVARCRLHNIPSDDRTPPRKFEKQERSHIEDGKNDKCPRKHCRFGTSLSPTQDVSRQHGRYSPDSYAPGGAFRETPRPTGKPL